MLVVVECRWNTCMRHFDYNTSEFMIWIKLRIQCYFAFELLSIFRTLLAKRCNIFSINFQVTISNIYQNVKYFLVRRYQCVCKGQNRNDWLRKFRTGSILSERVLSLYIEGKSNLSLLLHYVFVRVCMFDM